MKHFSTIGSIPWISCTQIGWNPHFSMENNANYVFQHDSSNKVWDLLFNALELIQNFTNIPYQHKWRVVTFKRLQNCKKTSDFHSNIAYPYKFLSFSIPNNYFCLSYGCYNLYRCIYTFPTNQVGCKCLFKQQTPNYYFPSKILSEHLNSNSN